MEIIVTTKLCFVFLMEMPINQFCFFYANGFCNALNISVFYLFYALETLQEQVAGFWADTWNVVEFAVERVFRAFVAVEGDGIAVNLVLNAGEYVEKFAICL